MVKGLAKCWDRIRHGLWTKCVDACLFGVEERLLPNDGTDCIFMGRRCQKQAKAQAWWQPLTWLPPASAVGLDQPPPVRDERGKGIPGFQEEDNACPSSICSGDMAFTTAALCSAAFDEPLAAARFHSM